MSIKKTETFLPVKLEDLTRFVLIGREKLVAVRAAIKAIDKVGVAKEVREQKLEEGQQLGGALLDAEAKIGELLSEIPLQQGKRTDRELSTTAGGKSKGEIIRDLGFKETQAIRFEQLAKHADVIERVKAEAAENEDIPTRSEVLRIIKEEARSDARTEYLKEVEVSRKKKPVKNAIPNLILADPPWKYDFSETTSREIENKYETCDVDQIIKHIPPHNKDCILFLWATAPKLLEAIQVMDGWGFTYKTHAVWDKQKIGMGYWFRGQHEILIVATKGKVSPPDSEDRISSVFQEKRTAHSAKPDCVYAWIEKTFPLNVKLEMYCRTQRIGWQSWGNEV